jgi:hypothetical protein
VKVDIQGSEVVGGRPHKKAATAVQGLWTPLTALKVALGLFSDSKTKKCRLTYSS